MWQCMNGETYVSDSESVSEKKGKWGEVNKTRQWQ